MPVGILVWSGYGSQVSGRPSDDHACREHCMLLYTGKRPRIRPTSLTRLAGTLAPRACRTWRHSANRSYGQKRRSASCWKDYVARNQSSG
jgi:hypothetical protein